MSETLGICLLATIPGRSTASDRSEMVTQLLFGETYTILEEQQKWLRVICRHDQYECWIDRGQHTALSTEDIPDESLMRTALDPVNYLQTEQQTLHPITAGARLPVIKGNAPLKLAGRTFKIAHQLNVGPLEYAQMEAFGIRLLNTPYLWGGRSAFGIDCSGLAQLMFRAVGVAIPRDASQQFELGEKVDELQNAKAGDLAFFSNTEGKINHVGILFDSNRILHASSKVKIERITTEGILHETTEILTHQLCGIKRIRT